MQMLNMGMERLLYWMDSNALSGWKQHWLGVNRNSSSDWFMMPLLTAMAVEMAWCHTTMPFLGWKDVMCGSQKSNKMILETDGDLDDENCLHKTSTVSRIFVCQMV
jgi:hypothetical protein